MEMLQGVWKQHLRPRAVVGYGVKILLPSPPNYVTRSPGCIWRSYSSPESGASLCDVLFWPTHLDFEVNYSLLHARLFVKILKLVVVLQRTTLYKCVQHSTRAR